MLFRSKAITLDLLLKSNGAEIHVPMKITTESVASDGQDFSDHEMFCKAGDKPIQAPSKGLKNLQGGSASCGVLGQSAPVESKAIALLAYLAPLIVVLMSTRRSNKPWLALVAIVAGFGLASPAHAETTGGLNALQYSPVVDGVGMTEKATTTPAGSYNVGLFMDYANDPIEIGGDKNSRVNSIMDNLVTAHAVANVGLTKR